MHKFLSLIFICIVTVKVNALEISINQNVSKNLNIELSDNKVIFSLELDSFVISDKQLFGYIELEDIFIDSDEAAILTTEPKGKVFYNFFNNNGEWKYQFSKVLVVNSDKRQEKYLLGRLTSTNTAELFYSKNSNNSNSNYRPEALDLVEQYQVNKNGVIKSGKLNSDFIATSQISGEKILKIESFDDDSIRSFKIFLESDLNQQNNLEGRFNGDELTEYIFSTIDSKARNLLKQKYSQEETDQLMFENIKLSIALSWPDRITMYRKVEINYVNFEKLQPDKLSIQFRLDDATEQIQLKNYHRRIGNLFARTVLFNNCDLEEAETEHIDFHQVIGVIEYLQNFAEKEIDKYLTKESNKNSFNIQDLLLTRFEGKILGFQGSNDLTAAIDISYKVKGSEVIEPASPNSIEQYKKSGTDISGQLYERSKIVNFNYDKPEKSVGRSRVSYAVSSRIVEQKK